MVSQIFGEIASRSISILVTGPCDGDIWVGYLSQTTSDEIKVKILGQQDGCEPHSHSVDLAIGSRLCPLFVGCPSRAALIEIYLKS